MKIDQQEVSMTSSFPNIKSFKNCLHKIKSIWSITSTKNMEKIRLLLEIINIFWQDNQNHSRIKVWITYLHSIQLLTFRKQKNQNWKRRLKLAPYSNLREKEKNMDNYRTIMEFLLIFNDQLKISLLSYINKAKTINNRELLGRFDQFMDSLTSLL